MMALFRDLKAFVLRQWRLLLPLPTKRIDFAYYDKAGVGHIRSPTWSRVGAIDEGQWDGMKRQMRIVLWRVLHKLPPEAGQLDMRPVGVAYRPIKLPMHVKMAALDDCAEAVPVLFPLGADLAAACREHGLARLAAASMPDAPMGLFEFVHQLHEAASQIEAERRYAANMATKENPPRDLDPATFVFDTVAETMAMLAAGAFERPDLSDVAPLAPLQLGVDGEAPAANPTLPWTPPSRVVANLEGNG